MIRNQKNKRRTNYEVGKGRPPKSTRYKPGESGNPKGRPKGSRNATKILGQFLNEKIAIVEDGKRRKITVREAIVRKLGLNALKGDLKSIEFILSHEPEIARQAEIIPRINGSMTEQEAAEAWAKRIRRGKGLDYED
jgi:hypothetical protein